MSHVTTAELVALQSRAECIRNICILAHVDHGKTTLSDTLLSSNGIISSKLAGSVRFLDSREDEQQRGITMESSAISLLFRHERRLRQALSGCSSSPPPPPSQQQQQPLPEGAEAATARDDYLINLIDSPGHVDFSSDVSTAVRLCDGALLVVDVIEGVCVQTHAVLRQAWEERLRPCLVLNKVDRLATELQLTPAEAHQHLVRIVERINATVSALLNANLMAAGSSGGGGDAGTAAAASAAAAAAATRAAGSDQGFDFDEAAEAELFFAPERGNVVFASAVDGWAFRVQDFVPVFAEHLGQPRRTLQRAFWGEYAYNPKTKKVVKAGAGRTTLFAQYILRTLWDVYEAAILADKPRPRRMRKIVAALRATGQIKPAPPPGGPGRRRRQSTCLHPHALVRHPSTFSCTTGPKPHTFTRKVLVGQRS